MSDIKVFVPDRDGEGSWYECSEGTLDTTEHDTRIRNEVVDYILENYVVVDEDDNPVDADDLKDLVSWLG